MDSGHYGEVELCEIPKVLFKSSSLLTLSPNGIRSGISFPTFFLQQTVATLRSTKTLTQRLDG